MRTVRFFLVAALIFAATVPTTATDFVAKKLDVIMITSGIYQLQLLVRNDNVLADAFAVRFEIWKGSVASGQTVFSYTQDESTLAPFTERTVTAEQSFSPTTSGTYVARATVLYGSEIDPPDNAIDLIFEALKPGCKAGETWHAGPAMVIEQPLRIWPDTPSIGDKFRPGDVIGISALVSDMDLMEQSCGCAEEDTSVLRGPYPDDVSYEWSLEGPGSIIQGASGNHSTVMYQMPVCPSPLVFSATVSLRVRNGSGKAADAEISGSVTFNFSIARIYSTDFTPTWQPYTFAVGPIIQQLSPHADVPVEGRAGRGCTPQPPAWDKAGGISVARGIETTSAPFLCPEYLTLAQVRASDVDNYRLVCAETPTTCGPNDTIRNSSADRLSYQWSIIGGGGELVLPTSGPSIVVRRSASQPTILQCVINDGGAQADDDPVTLLDTLPAVGKPKAYVGLGDDEGTSASKVGSAIYDYWIGDGNAEPPYGGRSAALRSAWETMHEHYESAGYDVIADDSMLVGEFDPVFSDPCIKVFAFVGHGSGGHINMARMDEGGWNVPSRSASHVTAITQREFNCDKSPFLIDIVMLACETMKGGWNGVQVYGRSHGYTTTKFFGTLRSYAYWSYEPYPPLILTTE